MTARGQGPTGGAEKPAAQAFAARLAGLCARRGRLCVGIDPHEKLVRSWGFDYDAEGVERFSRTAVAALAQTVAVFKPQSAFFEIFGSKGLAALGRVLGDIRQAGALSILDVKRGDIGSTMSAYAQAYLAPGAELEADSITLSPYLGFESLRPALDLAHAGGRGVFVLCHTSNPEGRGVQFARHEGRSVAQGVVDAAVDEQRVHPLGDVGLVIGATHEDSGVDLSGFRGWVLAPGIGAQGGTIGALGTIFGEAVERVLPSASRGVLSAGPEPAALRAAAACLVLR
ncbi:orotidine-5'-phosphate decarboxylase [Propionibacterium cyclohexanicum]|uniref:Orotidine-5'-phosphate decarboxylase n=1 Tax=Propionibacterium cyclohexanicum TaxID=64702 RepID=A0A1H9Q1P2_9ACTN|nr:orotidine-5'-phosphate decarboxylase [Propionibacterium cyclohexanicum]SER54312.1 orotidine-5'-phosphate decarboxylase [Propionibacterium cyclohexanicum]